MNANTSSLAHDIYPVSTAWLEQEIQAAISRRDVTAIQKLVAQDAFRTVPDSGQAGLLSKALQKGFSAGALAILEHRTSTSLTAPDGTSLLAMSARAGDLTVCEALIARGAQVDADSPHCGTPLCEAASKGHAAVCSYLLACGADPNHNHSPGGGGPLSRALYRDAVDVCRVLVDAGADPAAIEPGARQDYLTPFQSAIAFCPAEVASFFIDSFPHLLFQPTLDGRSMVELADNSNRSLVLAAVTASAISIELCEETAPQSNRMNINNFGPL
jgi:ankyrin repeat protein